jgi:hypothetical protein
VLSNYNCARNYRLDPANMLREYLVQVYPDDQDLYVGKAYLAVGEMRIFVSYFVLKRENKSPLTITPRRRRRRRTASLVRRRKKAASASP